MATIRPAVTNTEKGVFTAAWANVTTADVAAPVDIGDLESVTVHVFSAGAGTAQMRGSNDGTNFVNIGSALAANTLTALSPVPRFLDFNPIATATVSIFLKGVRAV